MMATLLEAQHDFGLGVARPEHSLKLFGVRKVLRNERRYTVQIETRRIRTENNQTVPAST